MSLFPRKSRRHRSRRASFHQRQIRFFSILFGLFVFVFIAGIVWLLSRSPGTNH